MNKHILRILRFLTNMFGIAGWFIILYILTECFKNGGITIVNANTFNEMEFEIIISILIIVFIVYIIFIDFKKIITEEKI